MPQTASLAEVVAYLCRHYPHQSELSKARVTKMVYLTDWRSAIKRGHQVTSTQWYFNWYGPYVEDVWNVAKGNPQYFVVVDTVNFFGGQKQLIHTKREPKYETLTDKDKEIIDFVIEATKGKNWDDFIKLVYSTFPCVSQPKGSKLDLVDLAARYKKVQPMLRES
ncbi:Panacea domain-containing protein [Sorangium sp. So ce590]|uniref:Panacea domain-containing protein n=1 Tax=Sorangium sp. So ce590 TaxID=3133317 RepID=UPI003F637B78